LAAALGAVADQNHDWLGGSGVAHTSALATALALVG